jgi:hypothetical protein
MPPSRDFYPPEYTERSRSVLTTVREAVPEAVLIGGWGTWVRTGGPMSHDIDLIVTRPELATLEGFVEDLSESRHLAGRMWRATLQGVHLDLYVPYQSRLGAHVQLRTERLVQHREIVDRWVVLDNPAHLATKLAALLDRPDSTPGDKDRHEIMALLAQGVDGATAVDVLHDASARPPDEVTALIAQAFEYLGDVTLDRSQRRALNAQAKDWQRHSLQRARHEPNPQPDLSSRRRGPGLDL